jgi:hypothetical protein
LDESIARRRQVDAMTRTQAQAQLDALLGALSSNMLTVSIGGRSVTYRSASEIQSQINYWERVVAGFTRQAAGISRHGTSVVSFDVPQR